MANFLSFVWDEANIRHIASHDVSIDEVEYVLAHPTLDLGYQVWGGEERFGEAGATAAGRILQVVTTERDDRTRVVTAYDASAHVVEEYLRTRRALMATEIPKFRNEDEEAQWWYDHRDQIGADLVAASREGRSGEGTVGRQARRAAQRAAHNLASAPSESTPEHVSR